MRIQYLSFSRENCLSHDRRTDHDPLIFGTLRSKQIHDYHIAGSPKRLRSQQCDSEHICKISYRLIQSSTPSQALL